MRPGHPDVCERGRAAREDPGVRRLHVGVGPEDRRDAAVEPRGEGDLLARRLGVDVDHDHGRGLGRLVDERVDGLPHAVRGVEEERAQQVDHRDARAVAGLDDAETAPGSVVLHVRGPEDDGRRRQIGADLVAAPGVVAERDRVGARREQNLGEPRGDPHPVRDVLAVDDAQVDLVALTEAGEQALERIAAGPADDVADEEDAHLRSC